ncbi:MAG: 30S ribosomal protein S9 [Planctomycetota bacterium]|jgi:small subunit ribosomal protein S9|nr:30S ribosomal protein S9 [Planctomycetota bacterium]MDA1200905.1 30S ribosomal protein S9 [Planctomycetota bacterium]
MAEDTVTTPDSATDSAPPPAAAPATTVRAVRRGNEILATGRRKTAVARVRLQAGKGELTINGRDLEVYFPSIKDRNLVSGALDEVGKRASVKVAIRVDGGGPTGQAGACRLGIARALKAFDAELAEPLRQAGLLTRDGRMKERKKYGLRGARRGTQFSKR